MLVTAAETLGKSSSVRLSHDAAEPRVEVFPGELVWKEIAPFTAS